MHEFCFSITYDHGVDDYMDRFIDRESLLSRALFSCLAPTEMWALESVTGEQAALDGLERLLLDESVDRDSITTRDCAAHRSTSLLADEPERKVAYTHTSDIGHCDAVPLLAATYTESGLFLEQTRRGNTAEWTVYLQSDEKIGHLYDTLGGILADGLTFTFEHMTEVDGWDTQFFTGDLMRPEQREVLATAVEEGYFETPREVTLEDVATQLGLPRSTVSYRLRRATEELAKAFISDQR
jgi:predicted DNA binding protein